jgi:hypothetical protein
MFAVTCVEINCLVFCFLQVSIRHCFCALFSLTPVWVSYFETTYRVEMFYCWYAKSNIVVCSKNRYTEAAFFLYKWH